MSNMDDTAITGPGQVETLAEMQWSQIQLLRHKLQSMKAPLPGGIRQLFRQEQLLLQLETKPSVMDLPGLDQSQTLQQTVDAAAFSEQALLDTMESQARRHPAPMRDAGVNNPSVQHNVNNLQENERLYDQPANKNTTTHTQLNPPAQQTEDDQQHDSTFTAEAFLTPDFMQQWIDEILKAGKEPAGAQNKKSQSESRKRNTRTGEHAKPETVSSSTHRLKQHATGCSSRHKHSKVSYLPENRFKPELFSNGIEQQPRNSTATIPGVEGTQHKIQTDLPDTSAATSTDLLQGIALLQQLVEKENTTLVDIPLSQPAKPALAKQDSATLHSNMLTNNYAWQALEKSLNSTTSPTFEHNQNESSLLPVADNHKAPYQDEPERVAELVNEALVEQAMRNGVDLS